jgi:hypothetical protein
MQNILQRQRTIVVQIFIKSTYYLSIHTKILIMRYRNDNNLIVNFNKKNYGRFWLVVYLDCVTYRTRILNIRRFVPIPFYLLQRDLLWCQILIVPVYKLVMRPCLVNETPRIFISHHNCARLYSNKNLTPLILTRIKAMSLPWV